MKTAFLIRIITFLVSLFPVIPVSADSITGIPEGVIAWAEDNINISVAELCSTGEAMCDIVKGEGPLASAIDGMEGKIVIPILEGSATIGLGIVVACWIFAVVELAIQDRLTPETFVKSFARLGVGMVLVMNATTIYTGLKDFGNAFGNGIEALIAGGGKFTPTITFALEEDKGQWILIALNTVMFNMVVLLSAGIMKIVAYIVQISRTLEFLIRGAFLGIALGMLADDGWRGPGGRYIKKFLAVCAQGGVLILIGNVIAGLQASLLETAFGSLGEFTLSNMSAYWSSVFLCVGVGFAGLSVMFKSLGYMNDVFGA